MTLNMGITDRAARAIIGIVLAALPLLDVVSGGWAIVAYVVAALMLATAAVGFCPLYTPFGWTTRQRARPEV